MKNVSFEFGLAAGEICETIFSSTSHALLVVDAERCIRLCNPGFERLTGYNREQLLGAQLQKLFPSQNDLLVLIEKTAHPKEISAQSTIKRQNGVEIEVRVKLYTHNHSEVGAIVVFVFADITRQVQLEKDLRAGREQQKLLIEHTPAAVAMFDTDMRYIAVSRRWLSDYKLTNGSIIGKNHYEVFPEIPELWRSYHRRGLEGETFPASETLFTRADGTIDWVKWELCPWYDATGKIGGIILFTEVITERKRAEEAVQKANETLERKVEERTKELSDMLEVQKSLSELKSRFVTTASHEFRTPLSTLLTSSYLLEKYYHPEIGSKESKHFARIKSSVDHLTNILNDFLSLDKLESGAIKPVAAEFDIADIAHAIASDLDGMLKIGQKINISVVGPAKVTQDKNIVRNILYNLLSNAIKFSPENRVVELTIKTDEERVVVRVADQGIGIPEDEQALMFSRLFRAKNAANIQGTGLGLNIVKKYVELIGGEISFISKIEVGTTFTVDFPAHL